MDKMESIKHFLSANTTKSGSSSSSSKSEDSHNSVFDSEDKFTARETKADDVENRIKNDLDSAWKMTDEDENGYISEDEIYSAAQKMLREIQPNAYDSDGNLTKEGNAMFQDLISDDKLSEMDSDQNGQIDRGEFDSYYQNTDFFYNIDTLTKTTPTEPEKPGTTEPEELIPDDNESKEIEGHSVGGAKERIPDDNEPKEIEGLPVIGGKERKPDDNEAKITHSDGVDYE